MSDFIVLMAFLGSMVGIIFVFMDSVYLMDSGYTILDVFVAIAFLDLVVWFYNRIIGADYSKVNEHERGDK